MLFWYQFTLVYRDICGFEYVLFSAKSQRDVQMELCTKEFCLARTKHLYVSDPQVLCALALSVILSF